MSEDAELGEAVLRLSTDGNGLRLGIEEAHVAALGMQKRLDEVHNHIKDRFAEKFEHIGVHTFGHQLLGMVGITEGARPILGALKLGVNQVAESFGVAAGPIGLVVMGLAAMAAIGWKIHESHEKHNEDLAKNLKGYHDNVEAINAYVAAGGELDETLKRVAEDQAELTKKSSEAVAKVNEETLAIQKQTLARYKDMDAMVGQVDAAADMAPVAAANTEKMKKLEESIHDLELTLKANAAGFATWREKLEADTKTLGVHAEAVKKEEAAFDSWNKKIEAQLELAAKAGIAWEESQKKSGAAIEHMGVVAREVEQDGVASTTNAYTKKKAEIEKYRIAKQAEIDKIHQVAVETARSDQQRLAADQAYEAASQALTNAVAQKTKENYGSLATAAMATGRSIESSFAQGSARAIMSSTNMKTAATAISRQIAETIIADTIAWGVREGIETAMSIARHGAKAAAATSGAAVQVAAHGAVTAAIVTQTGAVVALTAALTAATTAAVALDVALVAAA